MTTYETSKHEISELPGPARLYWLASGWILVAVALAGTLAVLTIGTDADGQAVIIDGGILQFGWMVNAVHVLFAGLSLYMGYRVSDAQLLRRGATAIGATYLVLAVAGLVSPGLFGIGEALGMTMDWTENAAHLALGAWGLLAARAA